MGLIQFMEKITRLRNAMEKQADSVMKQKGLQEIDMTTLGELFVKYERAKNPVTRAVYREIIANRLNSLESKSK